MALYRSALIFVATVNLYATKTCDLKTLEICEIATNTLKSYTLEEFASFNKAEPTQSIKPGSTLREIFLCLYTATKERLNKNSDPRLESINNLLKSLTISEENDLLDVITTVLTNPGNVLYQNV